MGPKALEFRGRKGQKLQEHKTRAVQIANGTVDQFNSNLTLVKTAKEAELGDHHAISRLFC